MDKRKLTGTLLLFFAAFIWGTSFVAQDVGAETIDSFTYQAVRNLMAAVVLLPIGLLSEHFAKKRADWQPPTPQSRKYLWLGGLGCGLLLSAAVILQQFGIAGNVTSPGKDAFITALYIVFVPLIGLCFGKRSQPHVYLCVVVALAGLWLLCMGGSGITTADIMVIICSVAFSCHIVLVDTVAPHVNGIMLSCLQFFVAAIISFAGMLICEEPSMSAILKAWFPLFYSGVLSGAGAYTLQILGQKHTPVTVGSLVMSLEAVFAVVASMIMLPEVPAPTAREWWGMALIFAAIIVTQIPIRYGKTKKPPNGYRKRSI